MRDRDGHNDGIPISQLDSSVFEIVPSHLTVTLTLDLALDSKQLFLFSGMPPRLPTSLLSAYSTASSSRLIQSTQSQCLRARKELSKNATRSLCSSTSSSVRQLSRRPARTVAGSQQVSSFFFFYLFLMGVFSPRTTPLTDVSVCNAIGLK